MRPEILAPAGSMDALKAAVHAGADAVYLGGSQFGARAYADNFDEAALIEAIEYAHIYGVKVYLTVNTLFRDEEISRLYAYLSPFYEAGIDAVIVQDYGVMQAVSIWFPELPVHASTQMTITTPYAYDLLKEYGVTRIVPARELSIKEIAALKSGNSVPEIEVFVQGALCYCYSGQCLMSSFLGGRSGNRGRCAQPCRLPYAIKDENGNEVDTKGDYLLSPKDLCGLEAIPDLIKAGVDSFKIEGRMKKPEYVAAATRAYRKATDAYMQGEYSEALVRTLKREVAEVFNRGGYTKGYYYQKNGADMMSLKAPGHCGVEIGTVTGIRKNQVQIRLKDRVNPGDILVMGNAGQSVTLTCNVESDKGKDILLNIPKTKGNLTGCKVSRMLDYPLTQELRKYVDTGNKITLSGEIRLAIGEEAELTVSLQRKEETYRVTVKGDVVEKASAKPMTEEILREKITKTGGTRYQFASFTVEIENGAFYSLKALKELRRHAIAELEQNILERTRRCLKPHLTPSFEVDEVDALQKASQHDSIATILVSQKEQLAVADSYKQYFGRIYIDLQYFSKDDIMGMVEQGREYYYVLPAVLRGASFREWAQLPITKMYGVVVRNIDELAYLKQIGYKGYVITDYSVYAMNREAACWIRRQLPHTVITLPVELNEKQLERMKLSSTELEVYGYQQLMVSAQCVGATVGRCNHADAGCFLTDRMGKQFFVACICKYCYNLVYNSVPTVLFDCLSQSLREHCDLRLHFTIETKEETEMIIQSFLDHSVFRGEKTRGHYKRGVE